MVSSFSKLIEYIHNSPDSEKRQKHEPILLRMSKMFELWLKSKILLTRGTENKGFIGWLKTRQNRLVWKRTVPLTLKVRICSFVHWQSMEAKTKERVTQMFIRRPDVSVRISFTVFMLCLVKSKKLVVKRYDCRLYDKSSLVPRRSRLGQSWTLPWAVTSPRDTRRERLANTARSNMAALLSGYCDFSRK